MRELRSQHGVLQCSTCGACKPVEQFAFANMQTGSRQYNCRVCHAAYRRAHYLANKPDYIRRAITQVSARRAQNRREIYAYLRAHGCIDCGERDVLVLEFDHRDGLPKWKAVATLAMNRRWQRVREEIDKCDVRCVNCHRRRTARQFSWAKSSARLN